MGDNFHEQGFSIGMRTMEQVRTVSMSEVGYEGFFSEGVLGAFEELGVLEEAIPIAVGSHGILRIYKKEKGLSSAMSKDKVTTNGS